MHSRGNHLIHLVQPPLVPATSLPAITGDAVRAAIAGIKPVPKHKTLVAALNRAFPDYVFKFVLDASRNPEWNGRILGPDGIEIAPDSCLWLREQLDAVGGDLASACERVGALNYTRTRYRLKPAYFVAPTGSRPEDFLQLSVFEVSEHRIDALYGNGWSCVRDEEDFLDCPRLADRAEQIGAARYQFEQLDYVAPFILRAAAQHRQDVAALSAAAGDRTVTVISPDADQVSRKVRDLPGFPRMPGLAREQRLFQDWAESSAGRSGARFYDHWVLQIHEGTYTPAPGQALKNYCTAIPAWCMQKKLPSWRKAAIATTPRLVEWLHAFDQKAGHPFAWFFYMVHGNRIEAEAGRQICEGLSRESQWLPTHDRAVLERWCRHPYGF